MIDLYYWPTPNGHKITIFLEEAHLPYELKPVRIGAGEQFTPEFLDISPNNKIPAIVDHAPKEGTQPIKLFESGAILLYLAEKTGLFLSKDYQKHYATIQWLIWQVAGLGPMAGQNHHFVQYADEKIQYAIDRYVKETARLYAVLNKQLAKQDFIVGDYSIADMACYPWIVLAERQLQDLANFPHLKRWCDTLAARPAVQKAYDIAKDISNGPTVTEEAKKILFGQDAKTVRD